VILDWIGHFLVALALTGCGVLFLVVLGLAWLLRTHHALRREGLALEGSLIATSLPADPGLPHVVVQIPSYNEGPIIGRAVESAIRLDWPRDKLHVQVCDDSTDDTTGHAERAAEIARAKGFDVAVLHRTDRREFKAGALNAAREQTGHDYFAILDVDYVPYPDFLRRCMAVLLAEPRLAFVQARPDFLNAGENALTRAQAIVLDFHYGLEQPTRSWSGQALPFNGTCGIWRRAGIEAGGGWRGDMMTEDWDLSYRALLAGWRGMYVMTVPVPGELPANLDGWVSQQKRWAAGIGEVAWQMVPRLLFERGLSTTERLKALFPFGTWFGCLVFAGTFIVAVAAQLVRPSSALFVALVVSCTFVSLAVILFAGMIAANRSVGRSTPLSVFLGDFTLVLAMLIYISWANLQSVPGTLLGRRRVFARTPKQGEAAGSLPTGR